MSSPLNILASHDSAGLHSQVYNHPSPLHHHLSILRYSEHSVHFAKKKVISLPYPSRSVIIPHSNRQVPLARSLPLSLNLPPIVLLYTKTPHFFQPSYILIWKKQKRERGRRNKRVDSGKRKRRLTLWRTVSSDSELIGARYYCSLAHRIWEEKTKK